ncbi:MAG: sugar transferase [Treponema sp.]|nr:sugar transferase [Treponema sp.]
MFKRVTDIILSLIGLILTVWLWPFLALLIRIDSSGSVFFTQEREGRRGKNFKLYKFRSMYVNEQRVTKVGRLLRATRLDELPQFINVIKGDMSLIGPRPEQPKLASELEKEIPWYNQRLLVRPGITGWDQVCGEYHSASKEDTFKKLQSDLYYIKNCSLFLDISILFKTIGTVFRREGK